VPHWSGTTASVSAWTNCRSTLTTEVPSDGPLPKPAITKAPSIVPMSVRCRHTIGSNDKAIGIEMVQRSQGNSSPLADQQILDRPAQIGAVLALLRFLQREYGISVSNIIGHAAANEVPQLRDLQG
jgi:hypothetical protein